jgi:hypothetical protein
MPSRDPASPAVALGRLSRVRAILDASELTWMPEQIVRSQGKRAAFIHARDTVLCGVAAH